MLCAKVWACAWVPDPQHHVHPPALAAPAASAHPPLPKRVRPMGARIYTTPPALAYQRAYPTSSLSCGGLLSILPPPCALAYQCTLIPPAALTTVGCYITPSMTKSLYEPATRDGGREKTLSPAIDALYLCSQ